jgi:hypothetical protein
MPCIFCNSNENLETIEHIVPESLGNKNYTLPRESICKECNNRFSRFEKEAISNSIIGFEKTRFAFKSKKGKIPSSKVGDIEFVGDEQGRKDIIKLKGVKSEDIKSYDPETGIMQVVVAGFEKNDVPISKFLLKIGYEALYKSERQLFNIYDFSELLDYLNNKTNDDWPFLVIQNENKPFTSITRFNDKFQLNKINCKLLYNNEGNTFLFRFEYGGFKANINLLNRNTEWLKEYIISEKDKKYIHPEHFQNDIDFSELKRIKKSN